MQTIRRLSEDTGDKYIESDNNFELPSDFLASPFENVVRGKQIEIQLPFAADKNQNNAEIKLTLNTATGNISSTIPVVLPVDTSIEVNDAVTPVSTSVNLNAQAPTIQFVSPDATPSSTDVWLWYDVPTILFVLLILMISTLIYCAVKGKAEALIQRAQCQQKNIDLMTTSLPMTKHNFTIQSPVRHGVLVVSATMSYH